MRFLNYPERDALRPAAAAYHDRVVALGASVQGEEFAYGDHPLQRLQVFAAPRPTGEVLLVFHGGNWTHGYKEWMAPMAPALNLRGITLVSAGYRLGPEDPFPAGFRDCAGALKWVSQQLASFGGQHDAMFLGGHSAGAHLAALLAVAPKNAGVGAPPTIAGCLPVSGMFLFGNGSEMAPPSALFPQGATEEGYAAASPLCEVTEVAPPFHLSWGSEDLPHIRAQSAQMLKALGDAGVATEALLLEGCDHFAASYAMAETDGPWVRSAESFMRRHRARR